MKRILCALLLCSLLCALMPDAFADGVQQVSLSIPCTVTVDVGEHGKVYSTGTTWTGPDIGSFQVWPGTRVSFLITPDAGYVVNVLTLSGTDVREGLRYGLYGTVIEHNETLVVRFGKPASPSPTPTPSPIPTLWPTSTPSPWTTPVPTTPPWQVTPPYGLHCCLSVQQLFWYSPEKSISRTQIRHRSAIVQLSRQNQAARII